jgi:DNA polymerase-3 subunit epsilon
MEALWDAVSVRRCTSPPGSRSGLCSFAQMGHALCPCDGTLTPDEYQPVVERLMMGITGRPELLLAPLEQRIVALAREQRFEEAGWLRDRHRTLSAALDRRRAWQAMQDAGLLRLEGGDGGALVERGRLVAAWPHGQRPPLLPESRPGAPEEVARTTVDAEEAHLVWRWLDSGAVRLVDATGPLALPAHPVPVLTKIAV